MVPQRRPAPGPLLESHSVRYCSFSIPLSYISPLLLRQLTDSLERPRAILRKRKIFHAQAHGGASKPIAKWKIC
jgi:hypothetical protein